MSEEKKFFEVGAPSHSAVEHVVGTRYGNDHGELFAHVDGEVVLSEDYLSLLAGLQQIVDRSNNGELGTSKVIDMRNIALALLAHHGASS